MPTFVVFIVCAIVMVLVLAVIALWPWFGNLSTNLAKSAQNNQEQNNQEQDNQLLTLNIDVFKQRLAELEEDFLQQQIDKITYDSQKLALERQLLDIDETLNAHRFIPNAKSRLIFIIWIPCLVAMAYYLIADRSETFKLWQAQDSMGKVADDLLTGAIQTPPESVSKNLLGFVNTLQTNVHHHATDPMRWFRMSQVYAMFEASEQSIESLARAYRLQPDDEQIALAYAQSSFFGQGGMLNTESRQILTNLLKQNPKHQGAQMLMAMGEMREGNYDSARNWVQLLKTDILARSGDHSQAIQSLNELEQNINEQQAKSKQAVEIKVSITPEILGRVKKGDTLFVSIRAAQGGIPVAAKKLSADALTKDGLTIKISDNDSIMPTERLSQALNAKKPLLVTARISTSGDATAQKGDLQSSPVVLQPKGVTVMIDKVH
ncbi:cytochrome c biogenesis factor-like protein [Moraxella macacae 0408225]|uniref:Cytochrome c biogenesis factor-like protein n=1 Tax=Moraxella macacae 0408225 TaxID=1230338 RepID=L2F748_9GAMM|nr:c-type cytochrome biogenesis protein CcmI [Moraxella macacae]ELA08571.1 cytochrome c biogenesis factor-like protein [Moraxella macacae 0408225]